MSNEYKTFATGVGANTLTPAAWAALTTLLAEGFQPGLAKSEEMNTALRQLSVAVTAIAEFSTDHGGGNALDDGSAPNFQALFEAALRTFGAHPPGALCTFARSTPPSGWLECNGALISRTTYAALFTAIGTTFGVGDGSTTFKLPDMRGEFIRGWDNGRGVDTGRAFGTAQLDALQNVTGTLGAIHGGGQIGTGPFAADGTPLNHIDTGVTGTDPSWTFDLSRTARTATETRARNVALLVCIKT